MPQTPPKLIVLLGADALKAILNIQKISTNRGILLDCDLFGCKALATYHPTKVLAEPHLYLTLKSDFTRAKEFIYPTLKTNTLPPIKREYINSPERFLWWMEALNLIPDNDIYCDIETEDLSIDTPIVSMAFTTEIDGQLYGIAFLTKEKAGWWHADLNDRRLEMPLPQF